jgi:hypothetical protein
LPKSSGSGSSRRCAAITEAGEACRNPAAPGRPLCSIHAAAKNDSVGSDVGAPLYTEDIHDDERRLWDQISVTDLDAEIRVAKLQLKRLLAAQRRAELNGDNAIDEVAPQEKTSKRMTAKTREIDYDERVNRLLGRISDLVVTRARLQRELEVKNKERDQDPADDPVERLARRIDRVAARVGTKKDPGDAQTGGGGEAGA